MKNELRELKEEKKRDTQRKKKKKKRTCEKKNYGKIEIEISGKNLSKMKEKMKTEKAP